MGTSCVFSYLNLKKIQKNYNNYVEARVKTDHKNSELVALNDVLAKSNKKNKDEQINLATIQEELQVSSGKIASFNREKEDLSTKLEEVNNELDKLETAIADTGVENVDELKEVMEKKKKSIAELNKQIEEKNNTLKSQKERANLLSSKVNNQIAFQTERKRAYKNNSWQGKITAVDNHWGFAIVNAGKNIGLKSDTVLVVRRNNNYIGKIKLVDINSSNSIANITRNINSPNQQILPGDRVMIKNLRND